MQGTRKLAYFQDIVPQIITNLPPWLSVGRRQSGYNASLPSLQTYIRPKVENTVKDNSLKK